MNREIKFRGKSISKEYWCYGYLIVENDGNSYIHWTDEFGNKKAEKVHKESVGQLLTNKKLPNFFEGDIVTTTLPLSNEPDNENAYVITWENFDDVCPTEFVIGNTYDNPNMVNNSVLS